MGALSHLHQNHVIHCDVKPENAMVIGDVSRGSAHLKLIDFGLACFKRHDQQIDGQTGNGVVLDCYTPPEHLLLDVPNAKATDMWRLGCTLYLMLVRSEPFGHDEHTQHGKEERQAARFAQSAPKFQALSPDAKDLIGRLLVADPAKRLSAAQVLEHPW